MGSTPMPYAVVKRDPFNGRPDDTLISLLKKIMDTSRSDGLKLTGTARSYMRKRCME